MLNETVANQSPIHENKNRIAIEFLNLRLRNKTVQPHLAKIVWSGRPRPRSITFAVCGCINCNWLAPPRWRLRQSDPLQRLRRRERNQLIQHLASKNLVNALPMISHRRRDQQGICRRMQFKMLLRMRQRIMCDQRRNMRQLSSIPIVEISCAPAY